MAIPFLPIVVGTACFMLGLSAARVKFIVQQEDASEDPREYYGEPIGVHLEDGAFHEGNLQDLLSDTLVLETGEQQFLHLPLKGISKVEVYAS